MYSRQALEYLNIVT